MVIFTDFENALVEVRKKYYLCIEIYSTNIKNKYANEINKRKTLKKICTRYKIFNPSIKQ